MPEVNASEALPHIAFAAAPHPDAAPSALLYGWFIDCLNSFEATLSPRAIVAVALFDLVIDHQGAIVCLTEHGIHGSSFALVRPQFEAFIRAGWLRHCATDDQVEKAKDDNFPSDRLVRKAVFHHPRFAHDGLEEISAQAMTAMHSYTHGGAHQIARRISGNAITSNYDPEAIGEALLLANRLGLLALREISSEVGATAIYDQCVQQVEPWRKHSA